MLAERVGSREREAARLLREGKWARQHRLRLQPEHTDDRGLVGPVDEGFASLGVSLRQGKSVCGVRQNGAEQEEYGNQQQQCRGEVCSSPVHLL